MVVLNYSVTVGQRMAVVFSVLWRLHVMNIKFPTKEGWASDVCGLHRWRGGAVFQVLIMRTVML